MIHLNYPILSCDMFQNGVSHRCACAKLRTQGGIAPFWGSANLHEKVPRYMGYHSDSIATSRDMGPLRPFWEMLVDNLLGNVHVANPLTYSHDDGVERMHLFYLLSNDGSKMVDNPFMFKQGAV